MQIVDKQLKDLVDEIYRLSNLSSQSISSTASAVSRSGASKLADRATSAIVLRAQGLIVKEFVKSILNSIATERQDVVLFNVIGLDDYEDDTIDKFATVIPIVETIGIHSPTYKKQLEAKIAKLTLGNVSEEVEKQISEEINSHVDNNGHEVEENKLYISDEQEE